MAREWSERHIRELINRYMRDSGGGGSGDKEDYMKRPILVGTTRIQWGGYAGFYPIGESDAGQNTKAIVLIQNSDAPGLQYMSGFSGGSNTKIYPLLWLPSSVCGWYNIYIKAKTNVPAYSLGNKINEIPVDDVSARTDWWESNKGATIGSVDIMSEMYFLWATDDKEPSIFTSPIERGLLLCSKEPITGSNVALELPCECNYEANITWPQ